jgi:hypothetical protein
LPELDATTTLAPNWSAMLTVTAAWRSLNDHVGAGLVLDPHFTRAELLG